MSPRLPVLPPAFTRARIRAWRMGVAMMVLPGAVHAAPEGGVVANGTAGITQNGNNTTITQSSDRAVLDWAKFNVTAQEHVGFVQPGRNSVAVNRIHDADISTIDGSLTANGHVVLINPNGVVFGQNAKVDVQGLVASTAGPSTQNAKDWAEGKRSDLPLSQAGNKNGLILNAGTITARDAGLVGFVAPQVVNSGVIVAKSGKVHLASGDTATLDLHGDGLVSVAVSDSAANQLSANHGLIQADGGTVLLTAAAGQHVANGVINMDGVIQARSLESRNGRILLSAEGSNAVANNVAAHKGIKTGHSTVLVAGVLDASGRKSGQRGGSITVTGDNVALLNGARLDASGHSGASGTTAGAITNAQKAAHRRSTGADGSLTDSGSAGGEIEIGGDYLGQGTTPTAKNLYVDSGALILNDALVSGDAGRSIFWSDNDTNFYGNVYARALGGRAIDATTWSATAGGNAGSGGFVETSGHHHLDVGGYVDLTRSNALSSQGTYFLDPTDITIYGNVDPSFVSTDGTSINLASSLKLWLDASDTSKVNLTYNSLSTSATGTSGSTTLTVGSNNGLAVGARIRLGGPGSVTAASTVGADTYTIASISGTTVTLTSALTANYSGSGLYQGYVSQLTDKSTTGANAVQSTTASMPLWLSNGQNGLGTIKFDGNDDILNGSDAGLATGNQSLFSTAYSAEATLPSSNYRAIFTYGQPSTGKAIFLNFATDGNAGTNALGISQYGDGMGIANSLQQWLIGGAVNNGGSWVLLRNGGSSVTKSMTTNTTPGGAYSIGGSASQLGISAYLNGIVADVIQYGAALSTNARNLVEQYQSAKWGISLTPPGSGATEAAKAMASTARGDATDGYSVFTTRYLEKLSATADISLQASNNVNLDLKGDTLNISTASRNITLTAGNQITTASAGSITTNGGNITLTGTNGVVLSNAFALNAGTGAIAINTTNSAITTSAALTLGSNATLSAGTATITTSAAISTSAGKNLTMNADDLVLGGNISGTGTLTLQPTSTARAVNVNNGTADGTNFNLSTAEVNYLVDGWSLINIGKGAFSNSAPMAVGTSTWKDPTAFRSGYGLNVNGTLTGTGDAAFTFSGYSNFGGGPTITTAGGAVNFLANNAYFNPLNLTTNGGAVTFGGALGPNGGSNLTINTGGGALTLTGGIGNGTAASVISLNSGTGLTAFGGTVNTAASLTSTAGSYTFNGAWGGTTALGAISLTSTNTNYTLPNLTSTGNVTLNAGTGAVTTGTIATGAGNLTLAAGDVNFGGNISGTGILALQQASGDIKINTGSGGFYLSAADVNYLQDGWTRIDLGLVSSGLYGVGIGASTWKDPVRIIGNNGWSNDFRGAIVGTGDASFTITGAGYTVVSSGTTITTAGGVVDFSTGATSLLQGSISTSGGNISLTTTSLQGALTLNAGAGNIAFGGTVNGANSLTANAGNFTFNGIWGGTTALGVVSLTSANTSFTLPNLTSTGNVTLAAGTGTITTGTIATGAGNLTFTANGLSLGGNLTGTGALVVQPSTASRVVNLNNGTSGLYLTTAMLNYIQPGWGSLTFGSTASTGGLNAGAATFASNTVLNGGTGTITTSGAIAVGARNLTLTADDVAIGANLSGTGALTLQPTSASKLVRVNFYSGDFNLSTAELAYLADGWSGITIGNTTSSFNIGDATFTDPVTFRGSSASGANLYGNYTGTGDASFTFNTYGNSVNNPVNITTAGGAVNFLSNVSFDTSGGRTLNVTTNGGNIAFGGTFGQTTGSGNTSNLNAGTGTLSFGGTVNGPFALTGSAGTLTFNGAWGGTSALGNVSLTSANTSYTLPNLTSIGNVTLAAGTGTITTGTIAVGAHNLSLTADDLVIGGNLSGTGVLTLQPTSNSVAVRLNYFTGDFNLDATEIGYLVDGWSQINLGSTTQTGGGFSIGSATWKDPIVFRGNTATDMIYGPMTGTGDASFTFLSGPVAFHGGSTTNATITTAGGLVSIAGNVSVLAAGSDSITTNGGAISFATGKTITLSSTAPGFTLNSGGGAINLLSAITNSGSVAGKSISINSGLGTTNFGGTVNGGMDLTAAAGAFTFNGIWGGTTALGNVSLTSANTSFTVPTLTTTGNVTLAAGTGTITTGTIATGTGNLTFTADGLTLGGNLTGTGALLVQPSTASRAMNLNNGTSGLYLTSAMLDYIQAGWGSLTFGNSVDTALLTVGPYNWKNSVTFLSGNGGITFASGSSTLASGAGLTATTTGSSSNINFNLGNGTIAVGNNADFNITSGGTVDSSSVGTITSAGTGNITISANTTGYPGLNIGSYALNLNAQGSGSIRQNSNAHIYNAPGSTVTTHGGTITYATSNGPLNFGTGITINSNGGDIIFGGRTTPLTTSIPSSSNSTAIALGGSTISAGGGNITMNGAGVAGCSGCSGITFSGTMSTSGAGNITLSGSGGGNTGGTGGIHGIVTSGSITAQNGTIALNGSKIETSTGTAAILISGGTIQTTGTGNIVLTATNIGSALGQLRTTGGSLISGGNISYIGDTLDASNYAATWNATGDVIIRPYTAGATVGVGSGAGTLGITDNWLSKITWGGNLWLGGYGNPADTGYVSNAGNMTINETRSFAKNVNFLSGGNITASSNGQTITTTGSGSIMLAALGDINFGFGQNFATTGTGSITERANGNIVHSVAVNLTTNGGAIVLNADRDANNSGAIALTNGTLTSVGGAITLGGGADPLTASTWGNATSVNGVALSGVTANAAGGSIMVRGTGYTGAASQADGIILNGSTLQTVGTGTVTLVGKGGGTGANSGRGIYMNGGTVSTVNGDITATGTGGGGATSYGNSGISLGGGGEKMQATGSGNLIVTGTGGTTTGSDGNQGVDLGGSLLTGTGMLTLTAIKGIGSNAYGISNGGGSPTLGGATASGRLNVLADNFSFAVLPTIQTTGDVVIRPYTAGTTVGIGSGSGSMTINDALLGSITWGGNLWLGGYGNPGDIGYISNAGNLTINETRSFTKNINFLSAGNILSSGANTITTTGTGSILLAALNDITLSSALNLTAAGTGSITERANNNIVHSGGGVDTTNGGALTLNADRDSSGAGAIALSAASNLASNGGAITLGGGAAPTTVSAYGTSASFAQGIALTGVTVNGGTNGNVSLMGTGYLLGTDTAGGVSSQHGIILNGATVQTLGTGTMSVTGFGGGTGAGYGTGVYVYNGSTISAVNGLLSVTGTGGMGGVSNSVCTNGIGISGVGSNKIQSTGTGNMLITGTGGANSTNAYGVVFSGTGNGLFSTGGTLKVVGISASASGIGIGNTSGVAATLGGTNATGNVELVADKMNWTGTPVIRTTADVILRPYTAGTTVGVGSGAGTLSLTDALLGGINYGSNLWLGGYGNPGDTGYVSNAGNMTIQETRSFAKNINFLSASGIATSGTGTITTTGVGNILLTALGDINLSTAQNFTASGTGSITERANGNIVHSGGAVLTATGGAITLNADRDSDGSGAIALSGSSNLASNGGTITLGGGANPLTSAAMGNAANEAGIYIRNSTIDARGGSGGAINLRGTGYALSTGSASATGIYFDGAGIKTNGAGTITTTGIGGTGNGGGYAFGLLAGGGSLFSAVNGDITLTGTGGLGSVGHNYGVSLNTGATAIQSTGSGNVVVTGMGGQPGGGNNNLGLDFSSGIQSASGKVTITGIKGTGISYGISTYNSSVFGGASASGALTIITDSTTSGGGTPSFQTTGDIVFRPYTTGTTVGIGGGAGSLNISDVLLGNMSFANLWIGGYGNPGDTGYISNAGNMTINETRSFAKNVNFLSAGNILSSGTGTITTTSAGNILLAALGDINLSTAQNFTASGTGTITEQANNNIVHSGGGTVISQGGAIVLNSDRDASGSGAIALSNASNISSNGGAITLGGGAAPATVAAIGNATLAQGIALTGVTLNSGTNGNISLRGQGWSGATSSTPTAAGHGIILNGGTVQASGTGTITATGLGGATGVGIANGVYLYNASTISTTAGDINATGTGAGGGDGISESATGTNKFQVGAGNMFLTGTGNGTGRSIIFNSSSGGALSGSGNVTLIAVPVAGGTGFSTAGGTSILGGASASGAINVFADSINASTVPTIQTTGAVTFRPYTGGVSIGVAGAAGALQLTTALLNGITAGSVTVGKSNYDNLITANAYGWNMAANFLSQNANILLNGLQTMAANMGFTATTGTGGSIVIGSGAGVAASGTGAIALSAGNQITTSGAGSLASASGNIGLIGTNGIALTYAMPVTSTAGNITFTGPLTSTTDQTFNAGTGTITAGSMAVGANNLTLTSDDVVLGGNISGTGTLTLQPGSLSRVMRLNFSAGDYNLDSTELGRLQDGWSLIQIGRSDLTNAINLGATAWTDPVKFRKRVYVYGTLAATGNASVTFDDSAELITAGDNINTNGTAVTVTGSLVANGSNGGSTWNVVTNGGAINIGSIGGNNSPVGKTLTLNAGAGAITFGGVVNGQENITANGGNLAFNGAWGGTTPLGNVSLTSANTSFTLPNLVSTGNVALNAGTGTITTGSIATGAGNLTLTSDDLGIGGDLSGSGVLTIQPYSANRLMRLNVPSGDFNLDTAELAHLKDGWSLINIGSTAVSHYIDLGSSTWTDPVHFRGLVTRTRGTIVGSGDASFDFDSIYGTEATNGSSSISTQNQAIRFNTPLSTSNDIQLTSNGGAIAINRYETRATNGATTMLQANSGGGTLSIGRVTQTINATGYAISLDSGGGQMQFTDTIDNAANLTAAAGSFTFGGIWGGTTPLGAVSLTSTSALTVPSITAASILARTTGTTSDITLASGKVLTASGTGNALTLASGRNFVNSAGSGALSLTGGGRWLIYSHDSASNTLGGLVQNFNRYTCAFSTVGACASGAIAVPGSGNGLLYAATPTLTATPNAQSVTYGDAATLSGYAYTLTGYNSGDSDTVTGSLSGSSAYAPGSNIGVYALNYGSGSLASAMGYGFTYANNATAITVGTRTLNAGLTGTVSKTYDATTAATLAAGNYTLSNLYSGDTGGTLVALNNPSSGTYDTKDKGTGKTVSVSGLSLGGSKAGNYTLAATALTGNIGTILAKTLTASLTGTVSKTYDTTNAASLTAGNYVLSGVVGSEAVTLNNPASGTYDTIHAGSGKIVSVSGLSIGGTDVGNYTLAATGITGGVGTILAKTLTAALTGTVSKTYDTTSIATLTAGNYTLSNALGSDVVTLNSPTAGSYDTIHTGTGKTVSVSGLALGGINASDYQLATTAINGSVGTILAKTLAATLTGTVSKTYDTTNGATLVAGNYTLGNALGSDVVTLNNPTAGSYDSVHVGTGKTVSVSGLSLGGANASDYTLASTAISGSVGTILAKTLAATLTGTVSKIYDTTNGATLVAGNYTLGNALGSDVVTLNNPTAGTYDTIHVGTGKTVSVSGLSLGGTNASDYQLAATAISGNIGTILAKTLTAALTGTVSKTYDTTDGATLAGGNYTLGNALGSDVVTLNNPTAGTYDTIHVGSGKTVSVSGLALGGTNASDYQLATTAISGGVGTILAKTLTATLTGTVSKTYDTTDAATLVAGNYTLGNALGSDVVTLTGPVSGTYDSIHTGTGKTVSVSGLGLGGTNASDYQLAATAISGNIGTILAKTLTAALTGTVSKTYDTTDGATLAGGNYTLGNALGSDVVTLNNPTAGTYDTIHAGSGKTVSVSGLALGGTNASDYQLATAAISGSVGTILAKVLTASLTGTISKTYDATNAATLSSGNYVLDAALGSDVVALNNPTAGTYDTIHAGSGKTVSVSGLTLGGANASDYQLASNAISGGVGTILAKTLTAAFTGTVSKAYDTTDGATLTTGNYTLTSALGSDVVTLNNPTAGTYDSIHVGTGKTVSVSGLSLGGANASDYQLAATAISGSVGTILAKTLTASLTGTVSKTYDTTDAATLTAGNYTLSNALGSDVVTLNNPTAGSYDTIHAGSGKTVNVSGLSLGGANAVDYTLASTAISGGVGTILAKTLTAALTSIVSKTYDTTDGATLAGGNYTLTSALGSDVVTLNNPTAGTYDSIHVGTGKTVSVSGLSLGGTNASDYTLASTAISGGVGTILAKTLTAALTGTVSKTYDTTSTATLTAGNYTLSNALGSDVVTLNSPTAGSYDTIHASTGKTVAVSGLALGGINASDYQLATTAINGSVGTILAKTLTASLTGTVSKTYDTTDAATLTAGNYTLTNALGSDIVTLNNTTAGSYDTIHAGTGKTVSVSGLALGGTNASDYQLAATAISGNIGTILAKTLTAALTGTVSKTYDTTDGATLVAGNYTLGNALGSDVVTLNNPTAGTYDTIHTGTGKTVSVSGLALGGANASDYQLATTAISGNIGTILAKTLTAALTGTVSKTYDTTNGATLVAGNYTLTSALGSDVVTLNNPTAGTYDTIHTGTGKTVSVSGLALGGANASDYQLAATAISGGVGTILAKTLTAALTGTVSKTYDTTDGATLAGGNYTLGNALGSDVVTLNNPTAGSYDTIHAGTGKTVSVSGLALGGANASDYQLAATAISGSVGTILAKVLTASLTGTVSKTYDTTSAATLSSGNYVLDAALGSDVVALNNPTAGIYDTIHAGSGKTVSVSGLALGGANASDYALAVTTLSGNVGIINAYALTAGLTGLASKTYDATDVATLSGGNYTLTQALGSDVVSLIAPTAGIYDNKNAGSGKGVSVSGLSLNGANAADYMLASTTISAPMGTILAKTLTAGLTGIASKTYDGTNAASLAAGNYALPGTLNGDDIGLNNPGLATYDTKQTGSGKLISVSGLALTGIDAANYSLSSSAASGNVGVILAKALSILGVNVQNKVYDGTTAATIDVASASFAGRVGSDAVTLNQGTLSASFLDAHAGTGKAVAIAGFSLSGADAANYTLNTTSFAASAADILPKGLTITVTTNQGKIYGDRDPLLTYSYSGLVPADNAANFTGALTRAPGAHVGNYAISQGSLAADGDYVIAGLAGDTFAISPASLIIRADDKSRLTSEPNPTFTAQFTGFKNADDAQTISGLSFASAGNGAPSGSYAITPYGATAADYIPTYQAGTLTVSNAPVPPAPPAPIPPTPTTPTPPATVPVPVPPVAAIVALPPTVETGRVVIQITQPNTRPAEGGVFADFLPAFYQQPTNLWTLGALQPSNSLLPSLIPAGSGSQAIPAGDDDYRNRANGAQASNAQYLLTFTPEMQKLLGF